MVTVTPGNDAPVSSDTNPPSAAADLRCRRRPGLPNAIADDRQHNQGHTRASHRTLLISRCRPSPAGGGAAPPRAAPPL